MNSNSKTEQKTTTTTKRKEPGFFFVTIDGKYNSLVAYKRNYIYPNNIS